MEPASTRPDLTEVRQALPAEALEFQTDALALETRPAPARARLVLRAVCLFLAVMIVWAAVSEVDRVVVARGKLVTTAQPVMVQSMETATIRHLKVHIGDRVKAGDIVATLDPSAADADLADLDSRITSFDAQIDRLRCEVESRPYRTALTIEQQLQAAVYNQRQTEFSARLSNFHERAERARAGRETSKAARKRQIERLDVLGQIEGMRNELIEKNAGSKLQMLLARNERLTLRDEMAREADRERELDRELSTIDAEREGFIGEWNRKLAEEQADAHRQRQSLIEQKAKAWHRTTLMELRAPVDAIVLDIAKRSEGSVIKDAEPLVTLVPADVPLELEVEIAADDIGRLRSGAAVRVKLEAFPFQRHGTLRGTVRTISADAFQREPAAAGGTGSPGAFFRARVTLANDQLLKVPTDTRLSPGLNAIAEIKVGHRTVLSYLLYPMVRAIDESITEP